MWEVFIVFLEENAVVIGSLGGLAGVTALLTGALKWPFSRAKPTQLADETIEQLKPISPVETAALTVPQFIAIRREMKADLEQELAAAHEDEKSDLRARIAEMEAQIADPDKALVEAQKTIADLTDRLSRMGNDIGGDRLAEAQNAFAKLDFSVADDIFAEVEERQKLEVQQAARAAFGRGEVAEAEIRWHDAAEHYARAARLDPSFETLYKAREFSWRAGDFASALRLAEDMLKHARAGKDQEKLATALNEYAISLDAQGHYEKAEGLYREALLIGEKTIGTEYPAYAKHLSNLAGVVQAQGRYGEAEGLYREALLIGEKTIGTEHPDYATRLNNLANVVRTQGRYEQAEGLYGEAVKIALNRLGVEHPHTKQIQANLDDLLAQKP